MRKGDFRVFKLTVLLTIVFILSTCTMNYRESKKEEPKIAKDYNMITIPAGEFEMGIATLRQKFDFLKPFTKD